uniref:Uncharacterized protein n=1 Tax=Ditylenchus dipsaci TaxID=166011 RepID=A0A915DAH5_9BILA
MSSSPPPNNHTRIPVAVLTHDEALELVLDESPERVLSQWNVDDLSALLMQITRYKCDRSGIERFAEQFENTSVEELVNAIEVLRDLNTQATANRYCYDQAIADQKHSSPGTPKNDLKDWLSVALQINKTKKINDESSVLLPKLLSELPSTSQPISQAEATFQNSNDAVEHPDYSKVYHLLNSILTSRSVNKAKSYEAAVVLKIFDEMEKDVDIQAFDPMDFKFNINLDRDNLGKNASNILSLPDNFLDLYTHLMSPRKQ